MDLLVRMAVVDGKVGNLEGMTTWCKECQKETDHNSPWHREYLRK